MDNKPAARRFRAVRAVGSALLMSAVLLTTAACGPDGTWQLPDRENMPTLTRPTFTRPPAETPPQEPAPEEPAPEEPAPEEPVPEEPAPEEPVVTPDDDGVVDNKATTWWPLLIIAGLGAGLFFFVYSRGKERREWEARLTVVRGELLWIDESLVPQVLACASAADASALWVAARPRTLAIDEELHALVSGTEMETDRARADKFRTVFTALVTAVNVETSATSTTKADDLRLSRVQVEQARAALRSALNPVPSGT